ncbi:Hypothetical Protein C248_2761 [Staphylococcus aureus 08BA02176]|nr:Hypothetical Protein C248_2761 [Staphylococcus aureus 08BA02176]CAJ1322529.1 Cytoplasmic protein [Staphylococcus aureus]
MLINEVRLYRNVFSVMLHNDLKRYIDF